MQGFTHPLLHLGQCARRFHRVLGQAVVHLLLHRGQARFHRLNHLCLGIGLGIRDHLQPATQLFLAIAQLLHMAAQGGKLLSQGRGHPCRAPGGADRQHQQDQDQQHRPGPGQRGNHQRVVLRDGISLKLDHVRPNNRSISLSFSST